MENKMEKAERFPLFINLRVPVACRGAFAGISMKARVLVEKYEDGEVWMYGINPGCVCAEGDSIESAHQAFSSSLQRVLFSAATEASNFISFAEEVRQLFNDTNATYLDRWKKALEEVRAGRVNLEDLPRESGETAPSIDIVKIVEPKPTDNPKEELLLARAA